MPEIQHLHDFAHTNSGYRCTLAPCTAMLSNAEVAANLVKGATLTDTLNHTWKKAGH